MLSLTAPHVTREKRQAAADNEDASEDLGSASHLAGGCGGLCGRLMIRESSSLKACTVPGATTGPLLDDGMIAWGLFPSFFNNDSNPSAPGKT